jgi:ectoine hydroxylase-related dioxygenase (phytanoyl-CoA dioxygenase family)
MAKIENALLFRVSEKMGVAKLYLFVWRKEQFRNFLNYKRTRTFLNCKEELNLHPDRAVIRRLVDDLNQFGVAHANLNEFENAPSLENLQKNYSKLLQFEEQNPHNRKDKAYIQRLVDDDFKFKEEDRPLIDFLLTPGIALVCAHYLGLIPKLTSFKIWRSHQTETQERLASQNWHRDYNEYQMVRVFLYFNDVSVANGAGEYIKGTHFKGNFFDVLQDSVDGLSRYSSNEQVVASFSEDKIVRAEGNAGSLFFMDTAGIHRGGYHPLPGERMVSLTTFSTAADLQPTRIRKPLGLIIRDQFMKLVLVK